MPEPRTPVMILVEASWPDQHGNPRVAPAQMQDQSDGGACIRLRNPIPVGTELRIQWRWDKFTGKTKYCRRDNSYYFVGIQKNAAKAPLPVDPFDVGFLEPDDIDSSARLVSPPKAEAPPKSPPPPRPHKRKEAASKRDAATNRQELPRPKQESLLAPEPSPKAEIISMAPIAPAEPPPPPIQGIPIRQSPPLEIPKAEPLSAPVLSTPARSPLPPPPVSLALRRPEPPMAQLPAAKEAVLERKPMRSKWLNRGPWGSSKPDAPGAPEATQIPAPSPQAALYKENPMPPTTASADSASMLEPASFQVELLPMEDIYRTAGILPPRKGYSIKKVIEMLNSAHMSGLSKEMKRVAILMALDAADVTVSDVLEDAKSRQQALDSHEAEQKKRAEAEWVRKAEENAQIEAELERIKTHHMARITRNLEAIAREQAVFSEWQTQKHQESQSMAEAAELCREAPAAGSPAAAPAPTPAAAAPAPASRATTEPATAMATAAGVKH